MQSIRRLLCILLSALGLISFSSSATAQTGVAGWGEQVFDSQWNEQAFVEVSTSW